MYADCVRSTGLFLLVAIHTRMLFSHGIKHIRRLRLAKYEALYHITIHFLQQFNLRKAFHAFRHRGHTQLLRQLYHSVDHLKAAIVHILKEEPIQLQYINRNIL